ncbi:hypothetical protein MC885_012519 [Smutsia gigantea]|nr:hypothetical protein MC885_012519 [Smutsia gigantea]
MEAAAARAGPQGAALNTAVPNIAAVPAAEEAPAPLALTINLAHRWPPLPGPGPPLPPEPPAPFQDSPYPNGCSHPMMSKVQQLIPPFSQNSCWERVVWEQPLDVDPHIFPTSGALVNGSPPLSRGAPASLLLPCQDLKKYGATTVVRVCEVTYDKAPLEKDGITVVDWPFDDGAPPPGKVVEDWLSLLKAKFCDDPGSCVAVHCAAGLGR